MPLLAGGAPGYLDGPAAQSLFRTPVEVVVDNDGNLFVGDAGNMCIRKISPEGQVTTYAGSGQSGWKDGPARAAQFKFPSGVSLDPRQPGALLVADHFNHCIRAIDPAGMVTTLAGVPGEEGYRDGPARQALFHNPTSAQVGPTGDVFVMEWGNHCIRHIDREGQTVSTLAGSGHPGFHDGFGPLAQFYFPTMCAIDMDGTLWVSDLRNHAIRRVHPDGSVVTVAGNGTAGYADGQGAEARFNVPSNVIFDGDGNLLVADNENHCIRHVTLTGCVSTLFAPFSALPGSKEGTESVPTCPCRQPAGLALTKFSELIISTLHGHSIFVVHAGVPPYQKCPVRRALVRHISSCRPPDLLLLAGKRPPVPTHRVPFAVQPQAAALQPVRTGATPSESAMTEASLAEVRAFLVFSYTSEIRSPEHIFGLMNLCQQYDIQDGFLQCLWYCRRHVTPANVVQWLVESHRRGLAVVSSWLQLYVHRQWEAIRAVAPQSFNLLQPYPELLQATIPDKMRLKPRTLPPPRQALRLDPPVAPWG